MNENVQLGSVHMSAGCDATLQGSTTESRSKDTQVHVGMVQPQSPKEQYLSGPPHSMDEEMLHDDGARDQLLKPSHEGLHTHAAIAPTFERSSDTLPTNASEPGYLPESLTPEDTNMISQPHGSRNDTNFLQHESGEKVNDVLDDVSANMHTVEKGHVHEGLTLKD